MNFYVIPAALVVSVLLIVIIAGFSRRPLRGFWLFFLLVFLATWSGQLWIHPFGPRLLGVTWIPLFGIGLFLSFIILALAPHTRVPADSDTETAAPIIVLGIFFWLLLILLVLSIGVGYYRNYYIA